MAPSSASSLVAALDARHATPAFACAFALFTAKSLLSVLTIVLVTVAWCAAIFRLPARPLVGCRFIPTTDLEDTY
jgi:hypothetical protein